LSKEKKFILVLEPPHRKTATTAAQMENSNLLFSHEQGDVFGFPQTFKRFFDQDQSTLQQWAAANPKKFLEKLSFDPTKGQFFEKLNEDIEALNKKEHRSLAAHNLRQWDFCLNAKERELFM
jgi:hypothetical protein